MILATTPDTGKPKGTNQANGNSLTMQIGTVTGNRLDRMGKSVSEIKEGSAPGSLTGFLLILFHDSSLVRTAAKNNLLQFGTGCRKGNGSPNEFLVKSWVSKHPVFYDFRHPGRKFAGRKGAQAIHIYEHSRWLMKGADQVFAGRQVDARLAPHRTVDHGKQGRRDLKERDATKIGSCSKTGQVTGNSAAYGKQRARPVDLLP